MGGQIENIKIENFWQYSLNKFLFQLISWRRKFFINVTFPEIFRRFVTTCSFVGRLRGSFLQKFISSQLTALFPTSHSKNYGKILFELSLVFITISSQINMEGNFKLYRWDIKLVDNKLFSFHWNYRGIEDTYK